MRPDSRCALTGAIALLGLIGSSPAIPHSTEYQPSTVTVTVVDAGAGYRLANADVTDLTTGQHRFTDEHGQARMSWPSNGRLRLRVREVGYKPVQRTLLRAETADDATTIALSKVAYVISTVRTTSRCASTVDSASLALSVSVLEQLRHGAEKYNEFRRLYPFEARVERRTAKVLENGDVKRVISEKEKFQSDTWEPRYKPGDIVEYARDGTFTAPVLFLSTLGDSVFWKHHCFIARGIETFRDSRAIRLEFSPTAELKGADWAGAALLDSATSNILRVEFRLVNPNRRREPSRLEGYQTFMSPSPYVIIPDTVTAIWWTRARSGDDPNPARPDFAQSLRIDSLRYRKAKPPGHPSARQ